MLKSLIGFVGRLCISLIFLASGLNQLLNWSDTEQQLAQALTSWLNLSQGSGSLTGLVEWTLPYLPVMLGTAIACELLGGLCVLLGAQVRFGAFLLIIFLIPSTLIMHAFWLTQGAEYQIQVAGFLKNISILGGLFVLIAHGCRSSSGEHSD